MTYPKHVTSSKDKPTTGVRQMYPRGCTCNFSSLFWTNSALHTTQMMTNRTLLSYLSHQLSFQSSSFCTFEGFGMKTRETQIQSHIYKCFHPFNVAFYCKILCAWQVLFLLTNRPSYLPVQLLYQIHRAVHVKKSHRVYT